jgi:4-hydroxybenzoate polyprenyltransferase
MARPYSLLWFVTLPTVTMALWLRAGDVPWLRLGELVLIFVCTDAALTTWNDVCDQETDRASSEPQRHTRPLVSGIVSLRWARRQVAVLASTAVLAAVRLSPWFALLLASGVAYGIAYSAKPVYAGGRPLVSQMFWVVLWPSMFAGVRLALGGGRLWPGALYVAGTVAFMGVGETLAKDLRDLENDAVTNKKTTPVTYGPKRAAMASLAALACGSGLWVAASIAIRPLSLRLTLALAVVLTLWVGRAATLAKSLRGEYTKADARALHVGSIRVFITVNLLLIAGLPM